MKKILLTLMALLLLVSVVCLFTGCTGEETPGEESTPKYSQGLAYEVNSDDATCTITGMGTCQDTVLNIPSQIDGYDVTGIGENAFWACKGLTQVTIGSGVTSIGKHAFEGCTGLTSITIPDSVTSIGYSAFERCSSLESMILPFVGATPNGTYYTYMGHIFGSPSYSYNSRYVPETLKSVTILGGSIDSRAFYGCDSLTSVTLGAGVTGIGYNAFYSCGGLTSLTIGSGVTGIGDYAFEGCSGLTSITVGSGNPVYRSAGNCLIETATGTLILGCKNSVIPTDGSVTGIGDYAFYGCTGLTSIMIPDSVTNIGEGAFYECDGLTQVTIGNGVESIGYSAFEGCTGLTAVHITDLAAWYGISFSSAYANPLCYAGNLYLNGSPVADLVIPEGVTSIGKRAFYGCTNLQSITVASGNATYHSAGNCLIETATGTLVLGCKNSVIPTDGSVTGIGDYAFCGSTGLTSIIIPDSVTSIGSFAFEDCTSLTQVTFQDPDGWLVYSRLNGQKHLTLTDAAVNATHLKYTYCDYTWQKN